jgi:Uma2 family endonuclease
MRFVARPGFRNHVAMANSLLIEERIEIPLRVRSFQQFRRWALSDTFPEQARIDYVDGCIEVEMSPEDLFCHGTPKTEIIIVAGQRVKRLKLGRLFTDRTRVSFPKLQVSVEPDIVFVSHKALAAGRVKLTAKAGAVPGRFVELRGAVDLIVEIISDSSEAKDKRRLPKAYYEAGVREFWLVDARGEELLFYIHRRGKAGFRRVKPDANGWQRSAVLRCSYRFHRERDAADLWTYELQERSS